MYITERQADIRFSLAGIPYGESWATASGGGLEASDVKTRPGGMGSEVSLGGPASRADLTLTTQMTDIVMTWHNTFEALVGVQGVKAKAAINWLDPQKNNLSGSGSSIVRTGTLKNATLPEPDASSTSEGMYTIVISCDEIAG